MIPKSGIAPRLHFPIAPCGVIAPRFRIVVFLSAPTTPTPPKPKEKLLYYIKISNLYLSVSSDFYSISENNLKRPAHRPRPFLLTGCPVEQAGGRNAGGTLPAGHPCPIICQSFVDPLSPVAVEWEDATGKESATNNARLGKYFADGRVKRIARGSGGEVVSRLEEAGASADRRSGADLGFESQEALANEIGAAFGKRVVFFQSEKALLSVNVRESHRPPPSPPAKQTKPRAKPLCK